MRKRWLFIVLLIALIPLGIFLFDSCGIHWVGRTDLQVEFVIKNATTGSPVPGARIEVQSEGALNAEPTQQPFVLTTDEHGSASRDCLRSMCFGTRSGLGFTDTFVVHPPSWRFRVLCKGRAVTEWTGLETRGRSQNAKRVAPGKSKLVVPVIIGLE